MQESWRTNPRPQTLSPKSRREPGAQGSSCHPVRRCRGWRRRASTTSTARTWGSCGGACARPGSPTHASASCTSASCFASLRWRPSLWSCMALSCFCEGNSCRRGGLRLNQSILAGPCPGQNDTAEARVYCPSPCHSYYQYTSGILALPACLPSRSIVTPAPQHFRGYWEK